MISVIIDTYNYARFIDKAVESVLGQDYPVEQVEIIVVDDGSTDNTRDVIASYGSRVSYIYKQNGGQASSFNTGIQASKGDIIALLDADDLWNRDKLKKIMAIFEKDSQVGIVRHYMQNIDEQGTILDKSEASYSMPADDDITGLLNNRIHSIGSSGLAFRREYLKEILPIPEKLFICPDEYLFSGLLLRSRLVTIQKFLAQRRLHSSNSGLYIDNILEKKRLADYVTIRKLLDGYLKEDISRSGLKLDNGIFFLSELAIIRSEIILKCLANNKLAALKYLINSFFSYKLSKYLIYKFATFFLIIVSPNLYSAIFAKYYKMRKN